MLKKYKFQIILSSLIILLPMLFGAILWEELPSVMTTHFGADGVADGFSGKAFAVFGLPTILLALHMICLLFTLFDKKQQGQNPKALGMIFWIVPMISLITGGIMYCVALGRDMNLSLIIPGLLGVPFIFIGNYMPKIKQNRTLGIKVRWALQNEENWNKTHRLGGKIMVAAGFVMLLSVFLPMTASLVVVFCAVAVAAFAPMLYSYLIYRQHKQEGIVYSDMPKSKTEKITGRISAVILTVILAGVAVMMVTGEIQVTCGDTSLQIQATYWEDLQLEYSGIDTIVYREELDVGARTNGFGSPKLSLGIFRNEEFGLYTLYACTGAEEYVVLTSQGKTLVIGLEDPRDTRAVYDTVLRRIGNQEEDNT